MPSSPWTRTRLSADRQPLGLSPSSGQRWRPALTTRGLPATAPDQSVHADLDRQPHVARTPPRSGRSVSVEVVLVHRPRYDDLTLPAGRLESGESLEECALREVAEETGYECRLRAFIETMTFEAKDGVHRLHIYEMAQARGKFVPNAETDRAEWLSIEDAVARATYPNVRALLMAAATRLR